MCCAIQCLSLYTAIVINNAILQAETSTTYTPRPNGYPRSSSQLPVKVDFRMDISFANGRLTPFKPRLVLLIMIAICFPLLKTGYSRRLEENDVWRLDEPRLTRNVTDTLERNFYARCPPSQRPLGTANLEYFRNECTVISHEEEKRETVDTFARVQEKQKRSTCLADVFPEKSAFDKNQGQHAIPVNSKLSASTLSKRSRESAFRPLQAKPLVGTPH